MRVTFWILRFDQHIYICLRLLPRNSPISTQTKVSGPFGLDMEFLQRIELSAPVKYRNPILLEPSLSDLNEAPINMLNAPKTQ